MGVFFTVCAFIRGHFGQGESLLVEIVNINTCYPVFLESQCYFRADSNKNGCHCTESVFADVSTDLGVGVCHDPLEQPLRQRVGEGVLLSIRLLRDIDGDIWIFLLYMKTDRFAPNSVENPVLG